jgi:anti-sigma-K factor RskA
MSPTSLDPRRSDADLAQLRAALRSMQVPPPDETALRTVFRAKQQERERVAAAGGGHWRVHAAAAAAVVVSVAAVVSVVTFSVERPVPAPALVPGTEQGGSIEADLLVGEDGLARGIRFNPADVAYASADAR